MIFNWDEMYFYDNDFYDKMKNSLPEDDDISHFDLDAPDINDETHFYYIEDDDEEDNKDVSNKKIAAEEDKLIEKLNKFSQKELDTLIDLFKTDNPALSVDIDSIYWLYESIKMECSLHFGMEDVISQTPFHYWSYNLYTGREECEDSNEHMDIEKVRDYLKMEYILEKRHFPRHILFYFNNRKIEQNTKVSKIDKIVLKDCEIHDRTIEDMNIDDCELTNTTFRNVTFFNIQVKQGEIRKCKFINCRFFRIYMNCTYFIYSEFENPTFVDHSCDFEDGNQHFGCKYKDVTRFKLFI